MSRKKPSMSRTSISSRGDEYVLTIGTLPINGHQNAWRAVKDLLKRIPTPLTVPQRDSAASKIQQVHIFETAQGRYAVCRFGSGQQARNAFDWIGGNVWHGARLGAWLYRVGSEWNSSANLIDSWEYYPMKSTPLETFWGIGNAFLQRTPTAGPISPNNVRPESPAYSAPSYSPSVPSFSPTAPSYTPSAQFARSAPSYAPSVPYTPSAPYALSPPPCTAPSPTSFSASRVSYTATPPLYTAPTPPLYHDQPVSPISSISPMSSPRLTPVECPRYEDNFHWQAYRYPQPKQRKQTQHCVPQFVPQVYPEARQYAAVPVYSQPIVCAQFVEPIIIDGSDDAVY